MTTVATTTRYSKEDTIRIRCHGEFKDKICEIGRLLGLNMSDVVRLACNRMIRDYDRDGGINLKIDKEEQEEK